MAKYSYRVYFDDGVCKTFVPEELKRLELCDLDEFSKRYKFYEFEELIKERLNTQDTIRRIVIINNRMPEFEYNLIGNNPFFDDIFNNLREKEIYRNGHKEKVISIGNSENYKEMKEFLFDSIEKDSKYFYEYVYGRNNTLKELLDIYVGSYKTIEGGDDNRRLSEVKDSIDAELRVYKTYRGLAISRNYYDKEATKKRLRGVDNNTKKENNNKGFTVEVDPESISYSRKSNYTGVDDYNYENDELLTEEEFASMFGGDDFGGKRPL